MTLTDGHASADALTSQPFVSVILPAYNEQHRLPRALGAILAYFGSQSYEWEVLVVENGSSDQTLAVARDYAGKDNRIRVFQESQRGKGLAVRRGMLEARGQNRFMCDVDLSMPIEEIALFLPPKMQQVDVAIGSREAPGSHVQDHAHRRFIGRCFNALVRKLVVPGVRDTQCGFKCFRDEAAKQIFGKLVTTGLSFDVEALSLARRLGYKIVEVPITWRADDETRVRLGSDSLRMAWDVLRIWLRSWRAVS